MAALAVFALLAAVVAAIFVFWLLRKVFKAFLRMPALLQLFFCLLFTGLAVQHWELINSTPVIEICTIMCLGFLYGYLIYTSYVNWYFRSAKFRRIEEGIANNTRNCNQLNEHIEELKSTFVEIGSLDCGESMLQDTSNFNMKRRHWREQSKSQLVHNCSASVCKSASTQPFKYLCKYFNIEVSEETLSNFEATLNNFSAAEQGKFLLKDERDAIVLHLRKSIPNLIIRFHRERLDRELGFDDIDLSDLYFPIYAFQYVSPGGNSSFRSEIRLDIEMLDKFIVYLSKLITFRKSIAGQRALMTTALREKIKARDNFTCRICSLSIFEEKHLLLEIDHITPLAKGGTTSEDNLQTLCWKCNRSKGARLGQSSDANNQIQ